MWELPQGAPKGVDLDASVNPKGVDFDLNGKEQSDDEIHEGVGEGFGSCPRELQKGSILISFEKSILMMRYMRGLMRGVGAALKQIQNTPSSQC